MCSMHVYGSMIQSPKLCIFTFGLSSAASLLLIPLSSITRRKMAVYLLKKIFVIAQIAKSSA